MKHHHKYLHDDPAEVEEAGYRIEDGVVVDASEALKPNTRKHGEFTRWHHKSREELLAEEVRWAARSGPVRIIKPARSNAS